MSTASRRPAAPAPGHPWEGGSEHPLATWVPSRHSPGPGGHPRSVGRFARSQASAAARRVKVERPQRSAAERGRTTLTRHAAKGDWAQCEASDRPLGSPASPTLLSTRPGSRRLRLRSEANKILSQWVEATTTLTTTAIRSAPGRCRRRGNRRRPAT